MIWVAPPCARLHDVDPDAAQLEHHHVRARLHLRGEEHGRPMPVVDARSRRNKSVRTARSCALSRPRLSGSTVKFAKVEQPM